MDYVVGSIAALISGNVTPNRPKLIRRALTPTKHPSSPNVTPKSEFVEDRSIFLSPTLQKKKAIVKKSPKRIFENPDLDITENSDSASPKADKVKKHLIGQLEADDMGKSNIVTENSPSNKLEKSSQSVSPNKKPKISDENTPKKKKRKAESKETSNTVTENMDVDEATADVGEKVSKSPKKIRKPKPVAKIDNPDIQNNESTEAADEPIQTISETVINQKAQKKKNKKKKNKQAKTDNIENNGDKENKLTTEETIAAVESETKSPIKKKNRKNKNKKSITETKETQSKVEQDVAPPEDEPDQESEEDQKDQSFNQINETDSDNESDEEVSNIANPNAITEKDTDSEHDSDDEIDSENEEINQDALKTDNADESSDEESEVKTKKGAKQKKKKVAQSEDDKEDKDSPEKEMNTEEEIKRTLFVGNVPFSNKCKKDIKRIFSKYGDIETVRIRTVPVKDARVTPKLAVIKNEIHPDRSTVNVYVKFAESDSVELALAENNTVLNHHHLRVSRSGSTGVEHDPHMAVFLGNLPFGIEDETLRAKFEKCGEIESVRIVRDKKTNAGKGFGYINFTSKDGVELALELSEEDLTVKNRIIRVKRCTNTLNSKTKNENKSVKQAHRKDFGNSQGQNRNFGNNSGLNRSFGNNQGQNRNFGNNQRNFGNNQNRNQGPRNFGNNQGPNRNFGNNQGQNRNFGNNQGQNRNFGNNQGQNRNFGNNQGPRNFGNNQNKFGNQGNDASGASRRIMNKRPHQENNDGPPTKKQHLSQPPREKKQKKEFVGVTAEKKKKQKLNKGQKKNKVISEIMTKKT